MRPMLMPLQEEARGVLEKHASGAFFLRLSQYPRSLWVSDFPLRQDQAALQKSLPALESLGFASALQKATGLLEIDLSLERYRALLSPYPVRLPALPKKDALHPAFSLFRLLWLHPAPLEAQPLEPLRQWLKAAASHSSGMGLGLVPVLHQQCALWLRQGLPLPCAVLPILSAWISAWDLDVDKGGNR